MEDNKKMLKPGDKVMIQFIVDKVVGGGYGNWIYLSKMVDDNNKVYLPPLLEDKIRLDNDDYWGKKK